MRGAYLWYDFTSMPQPAAAAPKAAAPKAAGPVSTTAQSSGPTTVAHAGMVSTHSDHRVCSEDGGEEVSRLIAQLKAAVDSIPSYMERCDEMLVLVPSVRHTDREGEVCDYSTTPGGSAAGAGLSSSPRGCAPRTCPSSSSTPRTPRPSTLTCATLPNSLRAKAPSLSRMTKPRWLPCSPPLLRARPKASSPEGTHPKPQPRPQP